MSAINLYHCNVRDFGGGSEQSHLADDIFLFLPLGNELVDIVRRHQGIQGIPLFVFSGPMCKIMVRFPNGSRTHMSLSAEASLKVSS